jgi:hypothetical protein
MFCNNFTCAREWIFNQLFYSFRLKWIQIWKKPMKWNSFFNLNVFLKGTTKVVRKGSTVQPIQAVISSNDNSTLVGVPNQDLLIQNLRTRRTKCLINFALEDFSRIHTQFSDKNRPSFIETPVYSFHENERIKFQLRFSPSKHSLTADAIYRGSITSAQLFLDLFLVDSNGRRFNFEYGRKVECTVSSLNTESLNNFIYDRDDLEKRRDKLFIGDKLVIGVEVNATWVDVGDGLGSIGE